MRRRRQLPPRKISSTFSRTVVASLPSDPPRLAGLRLVQPAGWKPPIAYRWIVLAYSDFRNLFSVDQKSSPSALGGGWTVEPHLFCRSKALRPIGDHSDRLTM